MSGKEKLLDDLTAPIKRRGNQPFVPTDKERQQVERMVGLGLTQEQIAKILNIAESTLKKYFREELDNGEAKANSAVAQNLFGIATSREQGSVAAAIFWMKTRGKWKEINHHAHGGDNDRAPIKIDANLKGLSDAELDQMQSLLGKASGAKE
jgi:transcriptional regulator with XRE-family HTH domain